MKRSLRRRLTLGSALGVVFAAGILLAFFVGRDLREARRGMERYGQNLSDGLATLGRLGVLTGDVEALKSASSHTMEMAQSVRFLDRNGEQLYAEDRGGSGEVLIFVSPVTVSTSPSGLELFDGNTKEERVGRVEVGLDAAPMHRRMSEAVLVGLGWMVAFVVVAFFLSRGLARWVLEPISDLIDGVQRIREGRLEHRVDASGPEEVRVLAHAFNAMAGALTARTDELLRQKRDTEELVYIASHDLQSPLVSISGFAQRLAGPTGPALTPEQERWVQRIVANTEHQGALIAGILDLSRLSTRSHPAERVDAKSLVDAALKSLTDRLHDRGVTLTLDADPWPEIEGDLPRLTAVFANLIDNAIKYLGPGNATPRIHIGFCREDHAHRFSVTDNGVGIDPAHLDRIFRPLERLKTVDAHGIGMGLTLVRKIVESHDGSISVTAADGGGTVVSFTLPALASS